MTKLTFDKPHQTPANDLELCPSDDDGCACGKGPWEMCDCGEFFLSWICGMGADGQCSLAGTEECDWECPRAAESAS